MDTTLDRETYWDMTGTHVTVVSSGKLVKIVNPQLGRTELGKDFPFADEGVDLRYEGVNLVFREITGSDRVQQLLVETHLPHSRQDLFLGSTNNMEVSLYDGQDKSSLHVQRLDLSLELADNMLTTAFVIR